MIRRASGLRLMLGLAGWFAASSMGAVGAVVAPLFEVDRDGLFTVVALPEPLSRREVRPHLASGLTTSFVVEIEVRDGRGRSTHGVARIEVRYELWDEVYLVRTIGAQGARRLPSARSFDELKATWQQLRLPIVSIRSLDRFAGPWKVEVALSVVPFSQSEQRDAQRWFKDSIAVRPPAATAPTTPRAGDSGEGEANGVLDLFLGNSIQRRSLVRYDWTVIFRPEAGR